MRFPSSSGSNMAIWLNIIASTRGREEVLGQAGVAKACAYTLTGV